MPYIVRNICTRDRGDLVSEIEGGADAEGREYAHMRALTHPHTHPHPHILFLSHSQGQCDGNGAGGGRLANSRGEV